MFLDSKIHRSQMRTRRTSRFVLWLSVLALCVTLSAAGDDLRVMITGLGQGNVVSSPAGIDCGTDCDQTFADSATVDLTATADPGGVFVEWQGDCTGPGACSLVMNTPRSVRAVFAPATPIPPLTDFTPGGIDAHLAANPNIDSVGRFVRSLPREYRQNWILMSRSESLQTGTATYPRILMPSADARFVFSLGLSTHSAYPGAHPDAVEYMQWDAVEKNFRFHEIVLDDIPAMGTVEARLRGVSIDDKKCSKCHSTRNVLNRTGGAGTTGTSPGLLKAKNKPNWDAYDSWGGALPFNRDRIYQGSVEAATFRRIFVLA